MNKLLQNDDIVSDTLSGFDAGFVVDLFAEDGAVAARAAAECEHAGSEQWYVCPRCDTVFSGARCPACWERWQAEMAGAGDPGAFRIVGEDASPGDEGGASDPLDPGFCPERV